MKYPGKKRGRSVIVLSLILAIGCIQQCSGVLNSQIKNQNNKRPSDSQSSPAQTVHRREFQQNYNFNSNSNNNVNSYNGIDQQDLNLSQNQNYNSNNNNRGNSNLSYNSNNYNNQNQNGNTNNQNQSNNYNNYNNGNKNNGNSNYNNQNGGELSSNSGPPYVNIYSYSQSQNGDLSNDNNNNNKHNNYYSQNNTSNNQYQIISQATGLSHNIPLGNNNKNNNQNQNQQFQNLNANNGQNQHRIKLSTTNSNNNPKQNNPNFFQTAKSVTTTVGTQLPNEVLNAVKTPAPLATPTLYAAPTSPPDLLGHKLDLPAKMFFMYSKPDQALYIYKVTKMNLQPQSIVSQLNYVPSPSANVITNINSNTNTHSNTNLPAAVPAPATPAPTYSSSILLNSNSVKQVPAPIVISNGPSYSILRNVNSNNNANKNNHDNFNQESSPSVYNNARPIINSNSNNQGGQEEQVRGQGQSFNPPPQDEWIRMTPQNPNQQQSVPNGGSHYQGNLYKKKKISARPTATVAPEITYGRPMYSEESGSHIWSTTKEPFHANSEENYDELIKENSQYNPRKQQQNSNSYNDHVASRNRQPNYRNRPRKQQHYDHEDEEPLSYGPPPVTKIPTVVSSGIAGPAQQFVQADGNGNDVEVRVRLRTQSARIRDADI